MLENRSETEKKSPGCENPLLHSGTKCHPLQEIIGKMSKEILGNPKIPGGTLDQILVGDVPSRLKNIPVPCTNFLRGYTRPYTNFSKKYIRPYILHFHFIFNLLGRETLQPSG